jgi:hypothetical protein
MKNLISKSQPLICGLIFLLGTNFFSDVHAQIFIEESLERGVDFISAIELEGVALSAVDFDQDGFDDLSLASKGEVYFYKNNGGFFQVVNLDIEAPPGDITAVLWADINNDGKLDLFLCSHSGFVKLYKQEDNLQFEDISSQSGIASTATNNWGASFVDFNRDGFLDLHVCRYESWLNPPANPDIEPEVWSRLYMNNGDETFTDLTIESGLIINPSPVFLGVFPDLNNDLWPDNYSIIDRAPGNELFINNQGIFQNRTGEWNAGYAANDIMSNAVGDYNNDGFLDIYMTNSGGSSFPSYLLRNDSAEQFTDVALATGVQSLDFCWGAVWLDADNNGWEDLYFVNQFNSPNYLFLNDGGTFDDAQDQVETDAQVPSFSVAKGDFDNNGYADLFVQSKFPNRSSLLMNQFEDNHFIKITPHGTVSNAMAIGTWIKVYSGETELVHFTLCGEGFVSQNTQNHIFGLGDGISQVDSVIIWYPSGHLDSYYNLDSDTAYHFYEGETYFAEIIANQTNICEGEVLTLDAGEHASYSWNTGDSTRYIATDTSGVYTVEVSNEFGITSTASYELEIQPNPIVSVSISPNVCAGGEDAAISLTNITGVPADSVIWDNGMEGSLIDSLGIGEYSFLFTDLYGCLDSGTVVIQDPPPLAVYSNTTPEEASSANGSISIIIFGGISPYTILFDGDTVSTFIDGLAAGTYAFEVIDSNGCTDVIEVVVENTLQSNDQSRESFVVYPNPVRSELFIESNAPIAGIEVLNVLGQQVKKEVSNMSAINMSDLSDGYYTLLITFRSGQAMHAKVLKR